MKSNYYDKSVELGTEFQKNNPNIWAGYDVVKYQKQIKDLVVKYNAKTILDYGCGKGLQYIDPLPYALSDEEPQWTTFDKWLGVTVYKYDPCIEEFKNLPPEGTTFDGVICSQVLQTIPDKDLPWVAEKLNSYTDKFCFISLNYQRPAKDKKFMYDKEEFGTPRTREFFKNYFTNWTNGNLFWWFKDRMHYPGWPDDQLNETWKDVPDVWEGKYSFVEAIYKNGQS
jgi:SAM-dependent methyltransferase